MAKPDSRVYSFDLGKHSCSLHMVNYLQKRFPGRLNITWGDSTVTLPKFHELHPTVMCDIVSVDGGHTPQISQSDMDNFMKMSKRKETIVLLDNHPDTRYKLNVTWEGTKSRGLLQERFRCPYEPIHTSGFSVGTFI